MFEDSDDYIFPNGMDYEKFAEEQIYSKIDKQEVYDSIFEGCIRIINDDLDYYHCREYEVDIIPGYAFMKLDITIDREYISDMLNVLLQFYIEKEQYEKCQVIKELQTNLNKNEMG